jgi:RNA recognition motif-containing protein
LDGHALQIKFSHRKTTASDASKPGTSKTAHGTKLIVRNVPFEATKKDIRELFGYVSLALTQVHRISFTNPHSFSSF